MDLREDGTGPMARAADCSATKWRRHITVTAPVQADQTGPSLREMMKEVRGFTGTTPLTQAELDRSTGDAVRRLAGSYETSSAVLAAMDPERPVQAPRRLCARRLPARRSMR